MRFVPEEGIPLRELRLRAQLTPKSLAGVLERMSKWWGYLVTEPSEGAAPARPQRSAYVVRPTPAGSQAQRVWGPLVGTVEQRWRDSFGHKAVAQFKQSLWEVIRQLDVELPDYLPVGEPRLTPREAPPAEGAVPDLALPEVALPALMSKLLVSLAIDFERESDLSLGVCTSRGVARLQISANILRVLDGTGVPVPEIPRLTGVAKMATDNWLGALELHRYVTLGPGPGRSKSARLMGQSGRPELGSTLRPGPNQCPSSSLEQLIGEPPGSSPLFEGIEPYPQGWRAQLRTPEILPQHPVISPRGGFPDGS
jgi:hypothetical protein